MRCHFAICFAVVLGCCDGLRAGGEAARWIWVSRDGQEVEAVQLRREFRTDSTAVSARIRFAALSAFLTISIDGKPVASAAPYDPIQEIDLDHRLESGDHRIAIDARGVSGPSACFVQLEIRLPPDPDRHDNESRLSIVSDSTWRHPDGVADDRGPVDRRLLIPESRRVGIDVVDNYEQWKQALGSPRDADPATFLLAPGFEIEQVRRARPHEDSWVSLTFDAQGRALIAKENAGLLRMTFDPSRRRVSQVEALADNLKECRGLMFIGDTLYANANNSKGLYRLILDGDQRSQPELIFSSTGGVGHGRNDLAVAGGMLYSIHGDAVDLPPQAIDYTSPFRAARRGQKTSEGHLLRIDPRSRRVEVLAAGLRNPFGIDFNADGELFTYDADAEYDMGAPWYRPTRVNHLLVGGDYGWRGVTKSWPPYYPDHPDNARPGLDIGKGSPTAVKFGTRSHFPRTYKDALFILDWAYGRIIAVHMVPSGSSYLMAAETFLKGRPLNVTDLDFGPDGNMYLVTGGRKTQSALYRVRYIGAADDRGVTATPFQKACLQHAADSRSVVRNLAQSLAQSPSDQRLSQVWTLLSNPDPRIRSAARNVLEHHPVPEWQSRALAEARTRPAVESLLALSRWPQHKTINQAIIRRLNQLLPDMDDAADKHKAFYAYWLCSQPAQELSEKLRDETLRILGSEYPSRAIQPRAANRLLSEILVNLQADDVVPKTIRLLNTATSQADQMHYLFVLRRASNGWTIDHRRAYFAALGRGKHFVGGAGMVDFLKRIRNEAVATLDQSERTRLGSLIEDDGASPEPPPSQPRSHVRKWTVDDVIQSLPNDRTPDLSRGADVFAAASCVQCHRFGSRGTLIGPDLTAAARRFSRRDLLMSMIEPSKVIAENYQSLQVVTVDGKTYVGQATLGGDYRSPVLRIAPDPRQPFRTIEIPKNDIESQKRSAVSWMPEGLLDSFTSDEIFDLLAYLESSP